MSRIPEPPFVLGPRRETDEEFLARQQPVIDSIIKRFQEGQMTTRCKFHCSSVRKFMTREGTGEKFVYEAEFSAVYDGSEENKKFFEWTPSGSLKIGVYKEDVFQPGKDYYLDLSEAGS